MNPPLRRVAIAVLVLFGLLIANANYLQVLHADALKNDPANLRTLLSEYQRQRGEIVVDGRTVATSKETPDRLRYLRTYPGKGIYAQLTGFYSLQYGKSGLEQIENPILSGDDPRFFTTRLTDFFTGRDPKGGSVVLTLNAKAQQTAYKALAGRKGAVVALDPTTGAILTSVSSPSYDPNLLSSHDPAAIRAAYEKLIADPDNPLANRALSERYFPGSVFKVIVSTAAIKSGQYQPDSSIPAPDRLPLSTSTPPITSKTLENFEGESCAGGGNDTLIHALTISCNTAFADLAYRLGENAIRQQAELFGIDDEKGSVPLTTAASTLGDIKDEPGLKLTAIGQNGVQITPLEGAVIAATVANHGVRMDPFLVKELRGPDLSAIQTTTKGEAHEVMPADVADKVGQMMVSVVENGTGRTAQIPGITVAGKTGTADNTPATPALTYNWFVGYASVDGNPKVAVAVMLEQGGTKQTETTGGKAAGPIARDVMAAVLGVETGG